MDKASVVQISDPTKRCGDLKSEFIFDMHFASIDVRKIFVKLGLNIGLFSPTNHVQTKPTMVRREVDQLIREGHQLG